MRKGVNQVSYVKISGKTKVTAGDYEAGFSQGNPDLDNRVISIRDAVIRMNSTALEVVDRYYEWKGYISLLVFSILGVFIAFSIVFARMAVQQLFFFDDEASYSGLIGFISFVVIFLPLTILLGVGVFSECNGNTHYPIIFNRKTQMVHYYRGEGDIVSAAWREIVFSPFCDGNIPKQWGINGYVLADDGESITDTIPVPGTQISGSDRLGEIWEFVRCYMDEDCVEILADTLSYALPIEDNKESWFFSALNHAKVSDSWFGVFLLPFTFVFYLIVLIPRWIVMRTCKIPRWPQEIQNTCRPDDSDEVDICAENNPEPLWPYVINFMPVKEVREFREQKYAAMRRINRMLRKKYAPKSQKNAAHERR